MFPVTITLQNAAQLNAVMTVLSLGAAAPAEPTTAQLVQIAKDRAETAKTAQETAAAPVEKSAKEGRAHTERTVSAQSNAAQDKPAIEASDTTQHATASDAAPAGEVTYDRVAKAITERAKTDRAHVIATLDQFGVKKGPDLKPEQYADFLKALG